MSKAIDIIGNRFGYLTVISLHIADKRKWLCRCDCGIEKLFFGSNLRCGNTKSCGCYSIEMAIETNTKHGGCGAKGQPNKNEYTSWLKMKERCLDKNNISYPNYGGRGIAFCERWMDFSLFLQDMGNKPNKSHTLDRFPDVNGNYEPNNCRWATKKEQSLGKRNNNWIEYNGLRMVYADWERYLGIGRGKLYRYFKQGKTFEEIYDWCMPRIGQKRVARNWVIRQGKNHCNSKKVLCVTTNQIFDSATQAAKNYGCSQGEVSTVCNGKRTHTHGLVFKFI